MNISKIHKAIQKGLNEALTKFDLDDFDFNDEIKLNDIVLDKVKTTKQSIKTSADNEINHLLKHRLDNIRLTKLNINKIDELILKGAKYKANNETIRIIVEKYVKLKGENCDLNWIDTSNVTDMSKLFSRGNYLYNCNISEWDVSNVTDMRRMFEYNSVFKLDLSKWDVHNVKYMDFMFAYSKHASNNRFSIMHIDRWNVSNVIRMNNMFDDANVNNLDLTMWDVSNVTDFSGMFKKSNIEAANYLLDWDVSNATNLSSMFADCENFNTDLGNWDTSKCTNFDTMFRGCKEYRGYGLENWNVSNGTNFYGMFVSTPRLKADIGNWDMRNAIEISSMLFESGISCNLSNWDLQNVDTDKVSFVLKSSGIAHNFDYWPPKLKIESYRGRYNI